MGPPESALHDLVESYDGYCEACETAECDDSQACKVFHPEVVEKKAAQTAKAPNEPQTEGYVDAFEAYARQFD